ncbi:MAG TPA: hypothetical protein EYO37_02620 [Nitrospina sp.]|nr:hypothetical protein [Nitrospina sp.]
MTADRFSEVLKVVLLGSALNIVLNILVIPEWGVIGVAAVAGLTELFLFSMLYNCMNRFSGKIPFFSLIWRPALASVVMGFALKQVSWPLFPLIFAGAGVYLVLLLLLRAFNEHDFQVMRNVLNRTG